MVGMIFTTAINYKGTYTRQKTKTLGTHQKSSVITVKLFNSDSGRKEKTCLIMEII